ncbi:hypothetical protein [Nocardia suismassiliense]|uniref:hypothetical protein n=1 Tax=Nocardia suismassiliense TaxID=2077092 RepID=UPI000D1F2164|nr:hypothetical protein [Nocardia suismassiliense]
MSDNTPSPADQLNYTRYPGSRVQIRRIVDDRVEWTADLTEEPTPDHGSHLRLSCAHAPLNATGDLTEILNHLRTEHPTRITHAAALLDRLGAVDVTVTAPPPLHNPRPAALDPAPASAPEPTGDIGL